MGFLGNFDNYCIFHWNSSDFEIYGMTRSTLNSRNRRISSAESEPKGAKRPGEKITGEVTKEPKEQQSPPLFCVWGRSVEK